MHVFLFAKVLRNPCHSFMFTLCFAIYWESVMAHSGRYLPSKETQEKTVVRRHSAACNVWRRHLMSQAFIVIIDIHIILFRWSTYVLEEKKKKNPPVFRMWVEEVRLSWTQNLPFELLTRDVTEILFQCAVFDPLVPKTAWFRLKFRKTNSG